MAACDFVTRIGAKDAFGVQFQQPYREKIAEATANGERPPSFSRKCRHFFSNGDITTFWTGNSGFSDIGSIELADIGWVPGNVKA